jgi:large subunit ribosomal protein L5
VAAETENKKASAPAVAGEAATKVKAEGKKPAAEGTKKSKEKKGTGTVRIAAAGETQASPEKEPRLQGIYRAKVVPALMKEFQFSNSMQVPRIKKVVINCAVKDAVANPKVLDHAIDDLMAITGQKPVITRAKKAIASFKVREGNAVGVMVTLRRARMWEFLDRFVNIALPRVRDFKGVSPKSFDGRGNYSVGIREQIMFPEISYDQVDKIRGMTITIETSATTNEHARAALAALGMPFRK